MSKKNVQPKWKVYGSLILAVALAVGVLSIVSTVASHPTPQHRQTAAELSRLGSTAFDGSKDSTIILESAEFKRLENSPSAKYTSYGIGVSWFVQLAVGIGLVFATYRYLRRRRITSKPLSATVLINVAAGLIVVLPLFFFDQWFLGTVISQLSLIMLAFSIPFVIAFSILLTFLVARVAEWQYNRSHGFIEE